MAKTPAPDEKAIAAALQKAFLDRVKADLPGGLTRGWQRELARRTKDEPGVALRQSMISNVATAKLKGYRLDTLVRLRNYIGQSIDEILGLEPIARAGDANDPRVAQLAERVAMVERQLAERARGSDSPARSTLRSGKHKP